MDIFAAQSIINSNQINQPFDNVNQLLYKFKDKYGFSSLIILSNLGVSAISLLVLILTIKL
jgi:iron uptake system EfeUOB component EfeO/EfeM